MQIKKNDCYIITIEDMNESGEGVGKTDGYTLFVKDTVIGDVAEVKVIKAKKNYGYARLVKVVKPSVYRVEPVCKVARQCGGCQLQALRYEEQLRFKERKIKNNLERIGKFQGLDMEPIIGMEKPFRYRNKAQFPIGLNKDGEIVAGFYAGRTHSIIESDDCVIGAEVNYRILDIVKGFMKEFGIAPYDEERHFGVVRHVLIRVGYKTGQVMVCVIINGDKLDFGDRLVEKLLVIPGMTSISFNVNKEKGNVILGHKIVNLYGDGYIFDYIGDVQYRISPLSFYQVNPMQTEKLYKVALEYAGLSGNEVVWDLYCGIGTISLFLAQQAKQVYGVEIVADAIRDARENARLNGMENVEFFVGKAEEVLPKMYERERVYAEVIVVDPPRKGCEQAVLDTMVEMGPERIVYVSCDSATLARDLRYLCDRGYEVGNVQGVDMFGMTGCVECVCLMTRKEK